MSTIHQLGNTAEQIRVDLDTTRVSFGADTDAVHCWTCATAEMGGGAWLVTGDHSDGRHGWGEHAERYAYRDEWLTRDGITKTLVCLDCALRIQPDTARQVLTIAQRAAIKVRGN